MQKLSQVTVQNNALKEYPKEHCDTSMLFTFSCAGFLLHLV